MGDELPSRSRYDLYIADAAPARAGSDYFDVQDVDADAEGMGDRTDDELIGYVHSVQLGSTVDGPGLRFVAFLTGCQLRCQYCHNPDTWHLKNGKPVSVGKEIGRASCRERV